MVLLFLIPALLTVIYVMIKEFRQGRPLNGFLLGSVGLITLFNAVIMYEFFVKLSVSEPLRCVQQVLSSMIVPMAYMYFAAQLRRNWKTGITLALWFIMAMFLLPTGLLSLDLTIPQPMMGKLEPMMVYFFKEGQQVFAMHTADIVILIQALITLARLFVLNQTMRRYSLALSPHVRYFFFWWAGAIAFVVFTSFYSTKEFQQPHLLYTYYISYAVLVISIYVLFSLDLDLRPIMRAYIYKEDRILHMDNDAAADEDKTTEVEVKGEEEDGIVLENMDNFLLQSRLMAERVKVMMEEKRYLDPTFTADKAIQELGTNRTYFYRMVKGEFDCTFNELLVQWRMKHAASLLTDTELPIQDIAVECGYSDYTSFSRHFKHIYNVTPSKFRSGS